jgi:YD repeat-containing protein
MSWSCGSTPGMKSIRWRSFSRRFGSNSTKVPYVPWRTATWASTSFTYDSNGNLTNDGSKTYTWNARNQLTGLAGGITASFAYDGVGRRRAKTVSGTTTGFLYDGLNAVQELAGGSPSALTGLDLDEVITRSTAAARSF